MKELFAVLVTLTILGLFIYAMVRIVKKVFSWILPKNSPTPLSPVQASLQALEQKAKKQTKPSAAPSSFPSPNAKKSSKKAPDLPKKGFSSQKEEKEFQAVILALATEVGKLAAVKFVTETMGWGLKEAKDYCDRVLATAAPTDKKTAPPRQAAPSGAALGQVSLEKLAGDGKFEAGKGLLEQTGWNLNTDNPFGDPQKEEGKKAPKKAPKKSSLSQKASASGSPSPEKKSSFDLEQEVKQLMERTGWDYATAKKYCEQVIQYQQQIEAPSRLKKSN